MSNKYAQFRHIENGVAFTDPLYDENVYCQYRNFFSDTNWLMKLESQEEAGEYPSISFRMTFGRPTILNTIRFEEKDDEICTFLPMRYHVDSVELGIDSARMYCGNLKDLETFGESIAFRTGGDGWFGDLLVITLNGEDQPAGFVLFCSFDGNFMYEDKFFQHMLSSFGGKELSPEQFKAAIDPNALSNRMLLANELQISSKGPQKKGPAPEKAPDAPVR